jgi:hypothetical protein
MFLARASIMGTEVNIMNLAVHRGHISSVPTPIKEL